MDVNDVLQVSYHVRAFDVQNQVMVGHYAVTSKVGVSPPMNVIANSFSDRAGTALAGMLLVEQFYQGCRARRIHPVPTQEVISTNGQTPGSVVAQPASLQVSCVVTKRAMNAPVRTRGRIYFPSPGEDKVDAITGFTPAYRAAVQAACQTIFVNEHTVVDGANELTFKGVVFKREAQTFWFITGLLARQFPGTQRRRARINRGDQNLI